MRPVPMVIRWPGHIKPGTLKTEIKGSTGAAALKGPQTFGWAQVQNIKRDPFENAVGEEQKSVLSLGGALASASTAYIYNWNMLPVGQQLWLKELQSYIDFPPLQDPASYNLSQVLDQVKKMGQKGVGQ